MHEQCTYYFTALKLSHIHLQAHLFICGIVIYLIHVCIYQITFMGDKVRNSELYVPIQLEIESPESCVGNHHHLTVERQQALSSRTVNKPRFRESTLTVPFPHWKREILSCKET